MLVSLEKVSLWFGEVQVLHEITCGIDTGQKIGIVGVNGAGKSTLLKILTEEIPSYEGSISRAKQLTVGYLKQNSDLDPESTVFVEAKKVFSHLDEISNRLKEIESTMENHSGVHTEEYSKLQNYFEQQNGYAIEYRIHTILSGMGFGKNTYDKKIGTLSGGEKTRLSLCKLMLSTPDLLILDEPTNHLDFKTILWLEQYIVEYKKAVLIVSHDRYFLDNTVSRIFELEQGRLSSFRGNYTKYVGLKEEQVQREILSYQQQQEEIKKLKEYVAKNIVRASTSKMAKSRQKVLDKMPLLPPPVRKKRGARISFSTVSNPYKEVVQVDHVDVIISKLKEKLQLIRGLNFSIQRGEKIAIVGENGSGKSTFLKMLLGQHPVEKGNITLGKNVLLGYFDQEGKQLDQSKTVFEQIGAAFPRMTDFEVRSHLAKVLFFGDDIYKKTWDLSGGEKAKLAFSLLMLTPSNMLILDEPTNHLDLFSREVIEEGLQDYEGTLLFVSHDRYLLKRVATKIIEFTPEGMVVYPQGFAQFQETMGKESSSLEQPVEKSEKKKSNYKSKEEKRNQANQRIRIKFLEEEIEKIEEELTKLEEDLTDPAVYCDFVKMEEKTKALSQGKYQLEEYTEELFLLWE